MKCKCLQIMRHQRAALSNPLFLRVRTWDLEEKISVRSQPHKDPEPHAVRAPSPQIARLLIRKAPVTAAALVWTPLPGECVSCLPSRPSPISGLETWALSSSGCKHKPARFTPTASLVPGTRRDFSPWRVLPGHVCPEQAPRSRMNKPAVGFPCVAPAVTRGQQGLSSAPASDWTLSSKPTGWQGHMSQACPPGVPEPQQTPGLPPCLLGVWDPRACALRPHPTAPCPHHVPATH